MVITQHQCWLCVGNKMILLLNLNVVNCSHVKKSRVANQA